MIRKLFYLTLLTTLLCSCTAAPPQPTLAPVVPTPNPTIIHPTATPELPPYTFPTTIDPAQRYLFYLHGKIIEDQGLPAVSPDYGEYEYYAILDRFSESGFTVVSEQRPKNADGMVYAERTADQITQLLQTGIPANHITVVGASKGSYIAIAISDILKNDELNYVLLGSCAPDEVTQMVQSRNVIYGNFLAIYDSVDQYAGSCSDLFAISKGKGLNRFDEIVLHMGIGHGLLYKPLDEWMIPTIDWANE